MGIAMIQAHTVSPEEWLKAADSACYRAKQAGRGMLEFDRDQERRSELNGAPVLCADG